MGPGKERAFQGFVWVRERNVFSRRGAEAPGTTKPRWVCVSAAPREASVFLRSKDVARKENEIGTEIIAAAIVVHRELGPGLLETVYEAALAYELTQPGLCVQRQVPVPVV